MTGRTNIIGGQRGLDGITGRAAPAARTMYLAALTAQPARNATPATMAEISTSGYARQAVAMTAPTSADPPVTALSAGITFGPFTADPPNITHVALVSSASGTTGEITYAWDLDTAKDVASGDSISAAAGTCSISGTS